MTIQLKCANCSAITELPKMPKKFLCKECGVVNTPHDENYGSGEEACCCILPTGFEWTLPVGEFHVPPTAGNPEGLLFATADDGEKLTLREWLEAFGSDPRVLRNWMKKMGKEGAEGHVNLSTLKNKK